jgi:WD40 repeat protein/predicted AAA+ superfamily ATPase
VAKNKIKEDIFIFLLEKRKDGYYNFLMKRKDLIKQVILDFHRSQLQEHHKRNITVPLDTDKIISIIGPRRAGKTYFLYQLMDELLQNRDVTKKQIIYINFEDERLDLEKQELDFILQSYRELYADIPLESVYFFFDEIQNLEGWEQFTRRVYDTVSRNIFITGSNAKLLSKEIATSLRGRHLVFEVFPLSFSEYLDFHGESPDYLSSGGHASVLRRLDDFLRFGGFPGLISTNRALKYNELQIYYDTMIFRDLVERYEIKQVNILKYFLKRLMVSVTKDFSINKIYNDLKSRGFRVSKDLLYEFQEGVETIFLMLVLKKLDPSVVKQELSEKKIYCIDTGLINAVTNQLSGDTGKLLENMVAVELRRRNPGIFFYRGKSECDFVIMDREKVVSVVQVCESIRDPETREREIRGVLEASRRFETDNGLIITREEEEEISLEGIRIQVIPVYKYLLEAELHKRQGFGAPKTRIGILFMADVKGYTPQANRLGPEITHRFNHHYETTVRELAQTCGGEWIKRNGDGIILFFEKQDRFLEFVVELRERSRTRQLDHGEFFGDIRMVAHYGNFSFESLETKIGDVVGPEGIKVFRMEKYADAHDVLVTEFLLDILAPLLPGKHIESTLLGRETLKGFDRDTSLYKLVFREAEEKGDINPVYRRMEVLERETGEIPVFGDIYKPMSMADNFINLDIKTGREPGKPADFHDETEADEWMELDLKREKEKRGDLHALPFIDVKTLYEKENRGIILGLPGSGKTTILKYFAFREFQFKGSREGIYNAVKKKKEHEEQKNRVVLFIECRFMMSYNDWYRDWFCQGKEKETVFNVECILKYLTHCFLFRGSGEGRVNIEDDQLERAEKLVLQGYFNGRLSLLIDALDEAPGKEIKDEIVQVVKQLFIDCGRQKRETNRVYLTSRYSERERYFSGTKEGVLKPVFDVRPLDMEQLRQMAQYFYGEDSGLYKEFDRVVWQEEIAARVGGTPLTALLVIAYYQIFRKFDTRYLMYNIIVVFILLRVWKQIKDKSFRKDMRTFFLDAASAGVLSEEPDTRDIYNALSLLSYEYVDIGKVLNREDILGVFELFAETVPGEGTLTQEAELWLERMKQDHVFISAGHHQYVFIHSTVMEYLAARYVVEKLGDPLYLEKYFENRDFPAGMKEKGRLFFESETLPIAVGSGIQNGAQILRFIRERIGEEKEKEAAAGLYKLAMKCLAEFESFIDRQYQRKQLSLLHRNMEKQVAKNWDAVDWLYKYLKDLLLSKDKNKLEESSAAFNTMAKLSRPDFLQKYLEYHVFSTGDSEIVSLRESLLFQLVKREVVENWLSGNRQKEEGEFAVEESLLTLDSEEYNPEDKNFKYYQKYSGKELTGFLGSPNLKHSDGVNCVAVSPDGKYIVSGSSDHTVKLWERTSGKEVRTFKGHNGRVRSVCFSPEGTHILSGSDDNTVKLWDRAGGKEVRTFKGHNGRVRSVCFSPEGTHILSGSSDYTVKLWERTSGKEVRTFKGHEGGVWSVCFSPEGTFILSGSSDHTVKLWERTSGKEVRTFKGHEGYVMSVCFSPEGTHILSGSNDKTVKLWDRAGGKEVRTFKGHNGRVWSVCFSPKGTHILSGSDDKTVKLWDRAGGKEVLVRTFKGHSRAINSVCFSPEGTHILSGSYDSTVKLWDRASGKEVLVRTFKGHEYGVNSVCFSPEGTHILSGSDDKTVKLWDRAGGKEVLVRTFKGHCFSPKGTFILSGSSDHTVKLWDRAGGKAVRTFKGHNGTVWSVCFSPEGTHILCGSDDKTVKLCDRAGGKEVRTFKGHNGTVWSVCFSPEGTHILSGSDDKTVKLWDRAGGKEVLVRTFKGHRLG